MVTEEAFRDVLEKWRKSLVGISRSSALVKFRTNGRQVLAFDSPKPDELLESLRDGTEFVVHGERPEPVIEACSHDRERSAEDGLERDAARDSVRRPDVSESSGGRASQDYEPPDCEQGIDLGSPDASTEPAVPEGCALLHTPAKDESVPGILRNLRKTAEELYLDRGVSVLHLAFGLLHWENSDGSELTSPLLLVPVTLQAQSAYDAPRLVDGDDDEVINPALKLLLEERGADLDGLPDPEEASFNEVVSAVESALHSVRDLGEWRIDRSVHIGKFTFTKEAMYRDLLENEERVLSHPVVRALATTDPTVQTDEFLFDGVDASNVDQLAPEVDTPLVLDADSSQRAAIAAARDGRSFVMDGPPGTGKSQTIANMIATLIHDGKTVLFVSEKAAALDVVRNRLGTVGLDSFLFDIHSSKSSRRAVAEELAHALNNKAVPPKELDDLSRATLVEKRQALNAYATASNEARQPLNRSFHDAVGRLAQLKDQPLAPAPRTSVHGVTEKQFAEMLDAARHISRSWRPAVEGAAFIWRGVTTDRPLDRELDEARRHLERAEVAAAPHRELLAGLRLDAQEKYAELPVVLAHRDGVTDRGLLEQWLAAPTLDAYESSLTSMVEDARTLRNAEATLSRLTNVEQAEFPPLNLVPSSPRMPAGASSSTLHEMRGTELERRAGILGARAASLSDADDALRIAARNLGMAVPRTLSDAEKIVQVNQLRHRGAFPDRRWFYSEQTSRVRHVIDELERQHQYIRQVSTRALQWFTPAVLQLPLRDLERRFEVVHTGFAARFSAEYRTDKRVLQGALRDPSAFKDALNNIQLAIDWADAEQYMQQLVAEHAGVLGRHWNGPATDYAAIRAALATVEDAVSLLNGDVPAQTAEYLSGAHEDTSTQRLLGTAQETLSRWRRACESDQEPETDPAWLDAPIHHSVEQLGSMSDAMVAAAARISSVSAITGREHSLREAEEILDAVGAARTATQTIEAAAPRNHELFGSLAGDAEAIAAGLEHARCIRGLAKGPLDHQTLSLLFRAGTVADLEKSAEAWIAARDVLIERFDAERRDELRAELGSLEDGREMIRAWKEDPSGQHEWSAHKRYRDQLVAYGLEAAIEFCAEQRVSPEDIEPILEKTVLQSWIEDLLETDDRLRPLSSVERDAIVDAYRDLDLQLIHYTSGRIIRAANCRRPADRGIGETGLLRQEGVRKRKHRPSRELIGRARGAVQALKPVFMMSPLAVSQYLPSDLTFDVVIFDEASQVLPADAINSIYRGRALILAGDAKQLPPTTFFERTVEEDDETGAEEQGTEGVSDYQSVLELAKASGAFPGLGLKWHYRSQHESLIAFSNYEFYDGELITFPSALEKGDGIGVSFRKVNGVYQRGAGAANPEEARAVARRVLWHYAKRPELSLGVVTFSVAQRDAVEAALLEERREYPELAGYFEGGDRLDGFFVRSLESVQGDERDIIIFSIGYGPDEAGKIGTTFGVLNQQGGWRRLNVGITRARQAVEVIASMDPAQIPISANENVEYLRRYLEYADEGVSALAIRASVTGLDPESPFEDSVLSTIRRWGYTVEPQVGAAGYRIDIGVRHPELPGKFILGVECDGYQYHSAPAARDRDRLRDSILTGLGWTMHRIWGTSWYRHREQEEARLKKAIETAASGMSESASRQTATSTGHPEVVTEIVDPDELPTWVRPYRPADRVTLPWGADAGSPDSVPLIRDALVHLVGAEGPVHVKVVHARLRDWWGIAQIGRRIKQNIEDAIDSSAITYSGDFMYIGELTVDHVRAPSEGTARMVDHVHPLELAMAVQLVVRDAGFADPDEVMRQVSRIFGWSRTGGQIASALREAIKTAVAEGVVSEDDGVLVPAAKRVG
ncbi:DUF3320 domain-containing protein [Brachybacterium sp. GCM10030268]|uniref:DUF3320 domain-containing protein n=1 Tax=Brachybacterium sp. GCM10030268 TaxID=3273382 RepID=UPI00360D4938